MPIHISCPCGKRLLIPDGTAATKFLCPSCRTVLHAPHEAGVPAPIVPTADASEEVRPVEEPVEVYPEEEKPDRKRRQHAKIRRQGLNQVNRGLAIHYASTFAVYGGVWAAIIAALFKVAADLSGDEAAAKATGFFFCASSALFLIAGLIELTVLVLCLLVPAAGAKPFLFGALAAWAPVLALAVWVFWPDDHRPFALAGALVIMLGVWTLWMLFLRRLAVYLHQDEIAAETVRLLVRGLGMMLLAVVLLTALIGFIHLLVYLKYPFMRFVLITVVISMFLGMMRIAAATRFFESMVHFLLFPTGILFVFKYLDVIGSLRMVIYRRS
jgi:hypothetical protein